MLLLLLLAAALLQVQRLQRLLELLQLQVLVLLLVLGVALGVISLTDAFLTQKYVYRHCFMVGVAGARRVLWQWREQSEYGLAASAAIREALIAATQRPSQEVFGFVYFAAGNDFFFLKMEKALIVSATSASV